MNGTLAKINGVTLWYTSLGQGVPIVLLHGGPGSYDYLEPVAYLLDQQRYHIIRYEQRGSWRSESKGPYDVETFIEDVEQLRIHLGIESWVLCGHSWGATLALAYTAKYHTHAKGLIYLSGTGIRPDWHAEYRVNRLNRMSEQDRAEYVRLHSVVGTLQGEEEVQVRERLRELSARTDLYKQDQFDLLPRVDGQFVNHEVNQQVGSDCNTYITSEEFKQALSLITAPSLFLHGEADPRPYQYVRELSSSLCNSEFALIPEAGHYPWLDNPNTLGQYVNKFLERIAHTGADSPIV